MYFSYYGDVFGCYCHKIILKRTLWCDRWGYIIRSLLQAFDTICLKCNDRLSHEQWGFAHKTWDMQPSAITKDSSWFLAKEMIRSLHLDRLRIISIALIRFRGLHWQFLPIVSEREVSSTAVFVVNGQVVFHEEKERSKYCALWNAWIC